MHLRSGLLLPFACALVAPACGSLAADPHTPPVLATVHGELSNPQSIPVAGGANATRVAVVWLGAVASKNGYSVAEDLPVQPVFPSQFKVDLRDPPPAEAMADASSRQVSPSDPAWPAGFGLAIASIVAYEDTNGNGKLDLVDQGASAYVDHVLGANPAMALVYIEGTLDPASDFATQFKDGDGKLPAPGFNLVHLPQCTTWHCTDKVQWLSMDTLYSLALTSDPSFAPIMCRNGDGLFGGATTSTASGGGTGPVPQADGGFALPDAGPPVPDPTLPAANDPQLQCAADGYSFTYCQRVPPPPSNTPLCTGQAAATWTCDMRYLPYPTPSNWPCTVK